MTRAARKNLKCTQKKSYLKTLMVGGGGHFCMLTKDKRGALVSPNSSDYSVLD